MVLTKQPANETRLLCDFLFPSQAFLVIRSGKLQRRKRVLDSLAHHLRRLGLPRYCELGRARRRRLCRTQRARAISLARQGTNAISPGEAMALLESFLVREVPAISIRVD